MKGGIPDEMDARAVRRLRDKLAGLVGQSAAAVAIVALPAVLLWMLAR